MLPGTTLSDPKLVVDDHSLPDDRSNSDGAVGNIVVLDPIPLIGQFTWELVCQLSFSFITITCVAITYSNCSEYGFKNL
ncbi:unnamed protein product [Brugia timori]|uniref:Uncharacterized protein n=1 Tax=Brugia timori TaxID=42155 RepID=A0A3P7ZU20_9BILA|nr:unnamed protein product [Brugia timori]